MITIICNKCGRMIDNLPFDWNKNATCNKCGGNFRDFMQNNNYPTRETYNPNQNNLNQGIPHLYWNQGKFTTNPINNNQVQQPNQQPTNQSINTNIPISKEQYYLNKIKDWAFYIIVAAIVIYAIYRIIF